MCRRLLTRVHILNPINTYKQVPLLTLLILLILPTLLTLLTLLSLLTLLTLRTLLTLGVVLTQLAVSHPPQRMLFAGAANGVVRSFKFPLTGKAYDCVLMVLCCCYAGVMRIL
jgi:hypothetical protein